MKTITIQITVPDGVTVAVAQTPAPAVLDDFENEPLPPEPGITPFRGAAVQQPTTQDMCPQHGVAWKTVPAGVSKSTGKAYKSFRACPERGCRERPRGAA